MAKQFVVQLKNEPGAMATLAEAIAARGVDLRAIGGGSMGDSGHVIMTTADDETTKAVLDENGYTYIEGESILAEVDDRPGGMARLARALADAERQHLRPPVPRPLGRSGDVRVRRRRSGDGPPDPRTEGLAAFRAAPIAGTSGVPTGEREGRATRKRTLPPLIGARSVPYRAWIAATSAP